MFVPIFVQRLIFEASLPAATVPSLRFAPFRSVRPAPLPAKLFDALLKIFWPEKVWFAFSSATLAESRASAIVPVKFSAGRDVNEALGTAPTRFDAFKLTSPAPLPMKFA